jgi:hypothetical protein
MSHDEIRKELIDTILALKDDEYITEEDLLVKINHKFNSEIKELDDYNLFEDGKISYVTGFNKADGWFQFNPNKNKYYRIINMPPEILELYNKHNDEIHNKMVTNTKYDDKKIMYGRYQTIKSNNKYDILDENDEIIDSNNHIIRAQYIKIYEEVSYEGKVINDWFEARNGQKHHKLFVDTALKYIDKTGIIIQRGDVVRFVCYTYRNEGKLMYDGKTFVSLDNNMDEYDNTPSWCTLSEFPDIRYFENVIDHNSYRSIDLENFKLVEVDKCDRFNDNKYIGKVSDKYVHQFCRIVGNKYYYIVIKPKKNKYEFSTYPKELLDIITSYSDSYLIVHYVSHDRKMSENFFQIKKLKNNIKWVSYCSTDVNVSHEILIPDVLYIKQQKIE